MSKLGKTKVVNDIFPALLVGGSSVISLFNYCKHTILLNFYKDYVECHGHNGPVKPSEHLMSMISEVEKDLKDLASEDTHIQPIIVGGLRTIHAGTVGTLNGGIIGLPAYFEFSSEEDIDNKVKKTDPLVNEQSDGDFYESFLLTEKAKKFGIAREILCVNSYQVYVNAVLPVALSYVVSLGYETLFKVLEFHKLHPFNRSLAHVLLSAVLFSLWRIAHGVVDNMFKGEVEEELAKLGQDYVEGGLEFYSKALKRRSLEVELRDQNSRVVNKLEDKLNLITSSREIPLTYKIAFYKFKSGQVDENENIKVVEEDNL